MGGGSTLASGLGTMPASYLSPLDATLMDLPASVANKGLTLKLNPSDATLTKNTGWGYPSHFGIGLDWRSIVVGGAHGTTCSASQPGGPFGPRHSLEFRQVGIRHGHDQQGQQQTKCLPADNGNRDGGALL